ncbi:MAG: hypothetical protein EOR84_17860 [Mesorhizobium sp.]|uniref:hypothetical protein n=1 Tax=Mesorhizobium sp. TaxID=1871066 RepID=UPI000FE7DF78|nr:hypothetical protein [Mesorhizobium sp.]RWM93391.1 MAG: hypothetical protein EOR84_17860 [Mesorhizobium sp.]
MVLIDLGNYPLKGLDCTPRYLNMGRGVDFSLARLNAPNAGFPCFGIGDKPALIFKLLTKFFLGKPSTCLSLRASVSVLSNSTRWELTCRPIRKSFRYLGFGGACPGKLDAESFALQAANNVAVSQFGIPS